MWARGLGCVVLVVAAAACGPGHGVATHADAPAPVGGPPVAGRTYLGREAFVRYRAGDLPIVVSVPHGGTTEPPELPDRTSGTTSADAFTIDLAARLDAAVLARTGHRLHLVICEVRRTKVDVNREAGEGTQGHAGARRAWDDYHAFIEAAIAVELTRSVRVVYVDLHGHAHLEGRVELGYMLDADDLARPDTDLADGRTGARSSLRGLAAARPADFPRLLRGAGSLGARLAAHGYAVVPSPAIPGPAGAPYFPGGFSTNRYASDRVVAVQIEAPYAGVRDRAGHRQTFAEALARSLLAWEATPAGTPPSRLHGR